MSTTIEVNKQSVKQLLEGAKNNKFVIPEYQRPYAWHEDQIQTLFDDLTEFTNSQASSPYFLGTIVSFKNENNEQEIIDGQQRITTLFLLLRAIYTKLSVGDETKENQNFKSQIEPAIWKKDPITGDIDFSKTLIESRVINSDGNKIFADILKTGIVDPNNDDNYSINYLKLQELIDEHASSDPLSFFYFIDNILNHVILLPIEADTQDTALTIFSTLNDRGLPLSDADIFKAKIYNHLKEPVSKQAFIDSWQKLEGKAEQANESIQKLFYYYMFYLRALENDRSNTTPGARKYYAKNNFEQLYEKHLIINLDFLMNLWTAVNNKEMIDGEDWSRNIEILQTLDQLSSYPNEFWKYPVTIYYLQYRTHSDFENIFLVFTRRLFANIAARYVTVPTINAVKTSILNLDADIIRTPLPNFDFNRIPEDILKNKLKNPHRNTVRMLLKTLAYQEQDELLPDKWEIEHILPQKWQNSYFPEVTETEVKQSVEHLGNKVPFEKKLNIVASNNYFQKKKEQYENSCVEITKNLSNLSQSNWGIEDIRERDIHVSNKLIVLFNSWGLNQTVSEADKMVVPTDSEKKKIAEFKAKGWI